jgi:hypothetical protein
MCRTPTIRATCLFFPCDIRFAAWFSTDLPYGNHWPCNSDASLLVGIANVACCDRRFVGLRAATVFQ